MPLYVNDIIIENSVELGKIKKSTTSTTTSLNGTLSLTNTSKSVYIITGNQTGYTVQLPDATTMDIGDEFYIINNSTQTIDLDDNASTTLKTINNGKDIKVTLIDNNTAAGSWQLENQPAAAIDWSIDQGATNIHDNNVPHTSVTSGNPHSVTKTDVGLSNVPNTDATARANHTGTQTVSTISDFTSSVSSNTDVAANTTHRGQTNNPHAVTKTQVGLSNVPNTDATQRSNHTGSQLSSTISDFASSVRSTVLTGLSTATNAAISATDTILGALGKLQAQITNFINETYQVYSTTEFTTTSTTLVDITGFSITPTRSGTYNLTSTMDVSVNSNSTRTITAQFYRNGSPVSNCQMQTETSQNGVKKQLTVIADNLIFNGTTDSIVLRVSVSGSTISVTNRKMIASRKGA